MNFINTLDPLSLSFTAKEHSRALGNVEECKMFLHIHPSAELLIVTSGELTVNILGRDTEKISKGNAAFLFPFQSHSYERPKGTEYFRINFSPSLIKAFFTHNQNNIGERSVFPINLSEYEPFFDTVRGGKITYYKVKGFLYSIIADYTANVTLIKKNVDDNVLAKTIAYIDDHKSERISLSKTAVSLGYNEKYLSRVINETAGFGFSVLLSTIRIESARYLLQNTSQTVVDIAMECGFGSERNFYRLFKNFTGYTPNEYRSASPRKAAINDAVL